VRRRESDSPLGVVVSVVLDATLTTEDVVAICALYGRPPTESLALYRRWVEGGLVELSIWLKDQAD
jgi:hypothetical protein